jgi:hypoxanthine phosphoribosyltransferase
MKSSTNINTGKRKKYKSGEILVTDSQIKNRLEEIAKQIANDYKDKQFILLGFLTGAFVLTADLQRAIYKAGCTHFQTRFIQVRNYNSVCESSAEAQIIHDIDFSPKGENILLIDDVIETGLSLHCVQKQLMDKGALSICSFTLISKATQRKITYEPDYIGFTLPNVWIEGYGMDCNQRGRANPNIIVSSM